MVKKVKRFIVFVLVSFFYSLFIGKTAGATSDARVVLVPKTSNNKLRYNGMEENVDANQIANQLADNEGTGPATDTTATDAPATDSPATDAPPPATDAPTTDVCGQCEANGCTNDNCSGCSCYVSEYEYDCNACDASAYGCGYASYCSEYCGCNPATDAPTYDCNACDASGYGSSYPSYCNDYCSGY